MVKGARSARAHRLNPVPMTHPAKPNSKPSDPRFSPGPTRKHQGWSFDKLQGAALGRNHRSPAAMEKLAEAIDKTRSLLEVPDTHRIAIVPGSDTGAVEMAMWSMLGAAGCDVFAWEAFGKDWVTDAVEELRLDGLKVHEADYGHLPDRSAARPDRDIVFTWNGTTSGVRVPNADWISPERTGVTICDATSAAFAQRLDWDKLDVVTYSWQKVMGGEAAHGVLILSPQAVERIESYDPPRPIPKLFRMKKDGKLDEALFKGATINTPSLMCVEDYIAALDWGAGLGGLDALIAKADANAARVNAFIEASDWCAHLCADKAHRSNTGVCLRFTDQSLDPACVQAGMLKRLAAEEAAFDIGAYRSAPAGLRLWTGATIEADDLDALFPWLDWAYAETAAALS